MSEHKPIPHLAKLVADAIAFDEHANHDTNGVRLRECNGEIRLLIHVAAQASRLTHLEAIERAAIAFINADTDDVVACCGALTDALSVVEPATLENAK